MDSAETGAPAAPHPGPRPSLLGNDQPTRISRQKPAEAVSILSSLEDGNGRKIRRSGASRSGLLGMMFGAMFAVTVATAVVLALTRDTAAPATIPTSHPQTIPAPTVASTPVPSISATENSSAAIEDAPSVPNFGLPASPPPPVDAATGAATSPATVSTVGKPVQNSVAPDAKPLVATAPPPQGADVNTARSETITATVEARPLPATQNPIPAGTKTRDARVAPGSITADRDASLLAALVAYSEGRPAAEIQGSNKSRSASQPQGAMATASNERTFDPKRDVVTREGSVSTAELVRRCRMLGFFEGTLCRMRVCNNQWGKDPACPQPAGQQTNNP